MATGSFMHFGPQISRPSPRRLKVLPGPPHLIDLFLEYEAEQADWSPPSNDVREGPQLNLDGHLRLRTRAHASRALRGVARFPTRPTERGRIAGSMRRVRGANKQPGEIRPTVSTAPCCTHRARGPNAPFSVPATPKKFNQPLLANLEK